MQLRILGSLPWMLVVAFLIFNANAFAMHDADNQGRWNKPTVHNLPDKEVPGFLVNLGPTGARAILTENTFIVKYIFKDSPAVYSLKLDDVITGAFGKPFSKHTFGGSPHGYEGPIMDLGNAIETAEGKDGKLVLNILRGAAKLDVTINLEPIGTFSDTFPLNCKKSEIVRAKALKYLAEYPDVKNVWQSHAKMAVTLALLTSDDPKQFATGKSMALSWTGSPNDGTWTWDLSHQLITLSEYYILTKDEKVLPAIKTVVGYLEKAQYSGKILVWGSSGDKALEKQDYTKVDAAQQLYDGGFGHAPYVSGVGKNGYGPMQYTTILAVIAWQEAGRCGVNANPDSIKRAIDFIHRGTNAAGYVAYGGEFTLNAGLVDPIAWKKSTGGDNYVGRAGASLIAHQLSPEFAESKDNIESNKKYLAKAFKSIPDGHADANLGIIWGIMGSAASGEDKVLRKMLDYHKAYFNMMRCFDGSFVLLPGRDYADDGYYMASRYHPTATMALAFGLNNPKLLIQGIQISLPGVNPKALKGKMDTAYKAIVKKNFGEAVAALKGVGSENASVSDVMLAYVEVQAQQALTTLEELEKAGDIVRLKSELTKAQTQFGLLPSFKDKAVHFEDGFRQDAWRLELRLAENFNQLVDSLQRNRTDAYVGDMERFAEKHPDSLYGKWASEVAKEYRASKVIKIPTTIIKESNTKKVEIEQLTGTTQVQHLTSMSSAQSDAVVKPPESAPKTALPKKSGDLAPVTLSEYHTRLIRKLDSLLTSGGKLDIWLSNLGPNPERFGLQKVSDVGLIIRQGESLLPLSWRDVSLDDRARLAKSIAKEDDVEALLIAAVYQQALGRCDEAESLLSLAALKDAGVVQKTRKDLSYH